MVKYVIISALASLICSVDMQDIDVTNTVSRQALPELGNICRAGAALQSGFDIDLAQISSQYQENYYEIIKESEEICEEVPEFIYTPRYDANWFDEIQHIFARGSDARVRDIITGREFNIRRSFGHNHADVEPLTAVDAQIMNEIWGGHSWERRPVVVYVYGYVFAGSLTNFPHAGRDDAPAVATVDNRSGGYGRGVNLDAVKNNETCGVVCLHFRGSLLHGSNRSNPDHQAAVGRAEIEVRGQKSEDRN